MKKKLIFSIIDLGVDYVKQINVVAAIIYSEQKILITKRQGGEFDGLWEFPGGKIEKDETHREALEREICEELSLGIHVEEYLMTLQHRYDTFHLTMHLYWSSIKSGQLMLNEHSDAKWVSVGELDHVHWIPADVAVVEKIKESNFL